jgi:hypothetical protein
MRLKFLLEISDGMDADEARQYLQAADLIVLDGADEAKTFASTLGDQIQELMFSKPVRVKVKGNEQAILSVPIDLEASLWWAAPYIEFSLEKPLRRADFDRLRRVNQSPRIRKALNTAEQLYVEGTQRVVVTTRVSGPLGLGRAFTGFAIRPFSDSQLKEFFIRWFGGESKDAQDILSVLDQNPNMREICRLPIVATIVAVIKENGYDLPHSKTEVYSKRFRLLLERWDAARGVPKRTRIRASDKMMLLMRIALPLHMRHRRTFTREELGKIWSEGFERHYPKCLLDEILYELLVVNSLIYRHSDDQFSLGHLSFQEFLTAQALMHGPPRELLIANFFDPWWRNVLVFHAGLLGDISSLMGSLQQRYGIGTDSKLLSQMIDEARFTKSVVRDFLVDAIADDLMDESDEFFDEPDEFFDQDESSYEEAGD